MINTMMIFGVSGSVALSEPAVVATSELSPLWVTGSVLVRPLSCCRPGGVAYQALSYGQVPVTGTQNLAVLFNSGSMHLHLSRVYASVAQDLQTLNPFPGGWIVSGRLSGSTNTYLGVTTPTGLSSSSPPSTAVAFFRPNGVAQGAMFGAAVPTDNLPGTVELLKGETVDLAPGQHYLVSLLTNGVMGSTTANAAVGFEWREASGSI